jgi:tape measure domain-containing protein
MAETNQFNIEVGVDTKDSINKLKELSSTLGNVASSVKGSTSQMSGSFKTMTTNVASSMSLIGKALVFGSFGVFIKSALETSAQLEQTAISFEVFTGSAEVANNMLGQLKNQALNSPMQFQDIANGAKTLLGYGLTAEQVIPITKMLGDISGGNADKFARLSLAFGQVNAAGRLMGQEARQMINAGFNPLQAISDKTGVSMAVLTEKMKNGQISVKDVGDAFTYATSEGGRFFGMADRQSQTLQGQFNKLSESVTFAMAEIGTSISENLQLGDVIGHVSILVDKLKTSFINLNQGTNNSAEFNRLLKGTLDVLAIAIDLCIKSWGVLTATLGGLLKLATPVVDFFDVLDNAIIKSSKILPSYISDLGKIIKYFNDFSKVESTSNNPWIGPGSVTESVVYLENKLKELEGRQAFNVKFNKAGIQDTIDKITEARIALAELQKITGKPQGLSGLDNNPPGMDGKKGKSKRFKESSLDFSQEYDTYLKQFTEHRNKLIKQSQDSEREFDNIGLSGARKKLAILADGFVKQKAEYVKYGVDVTTITRGYLLKTAQLQGEVDAERIGALTGLMDRSISTNGIKQLNEELQSESLKFDTVWQNLVNQDKMGALAEFGASIYSAQVQFAMSIANGFGEIAGAALAGNLSVSEAFDALGNMFMGTIGDLLIQMGTSAVKFGLFKEGLEKGLTAAFGGGGALVAIGLGAIVAGYALKGSASKAKTGSGTSASAPNMKMPSVASKASGASYQYGGSTYAAQSMRLMIDLTGSITATQTGYSINKSFETTLRVTGR